MNNCFCILPWYSQEFGLQNTPCCLLPSTYDINQIKQDLLSNTQTAACKKCWDIESTGNKSRRQFENEFLEFLDAKHKNVLVDLKKGLLTDEVTGTLEKVAKDLSAKYKKS